MSTKACVFTPLGWHVRRVPTTLVPLTQTQAKAFVAEHHRHNNAPLSDVIRVGLEADGKLVAVGIAGRPIAQGLQDGRTLEVTRVCTLGHENACSRLYGALNRAARALGYRRTYTYTLASEPGTSPAAAGYVVDAVIPERDWAAQSGRDRYESNLFGERRTPLGPKIRWRRDLVAAVPVVPEQNTEEGHSG